ncbi:adaptor-related protein complex 3, delta 1 subunit-like garnet [Calliopsis andreniformis]|uniref:adaptor-related protein complex 3, delta 1 subunit-like garnet n=1 Tax=Calliopsis andreniformis TaxID=337506 RepID=UPI003FCE4F4D
MALRKVKGNFERMFDKNLTDLVRGIRNNKENEAKYIAQCIEEIKQELRQDNVAVKANAVAKLTYLQMLGYDISWAGFNIIEVMSSAKFTYKRIGYLAASQSFHADTELLMLTTNMIRKDLNSQNQYDAGLALSGLSCFISSDLARDLVNDIMTLLTSTKPYLRKKAVLMMYKVFLRFPEALRPAFPRLKEKLEDPDSGVQSAAVNVVCELARKNPKNYLSLAPVFFKLMTTSTNNWMLIKIIKLFGALTPLEPRLGKKLIEPLTNLIHSTSAMSLLYECINTVIAVLISISSGMPNHSDSIQLCVQKLRILIEDSDQNLKYLGLLAMSKILKTHPKSVQAHKDLIMQCLDDKDESIRLRALDLLYGMVSKKNLMEIVKKLMVHMDKAEGTAYRDELLSKIIQICSQNNYQFVTCFEWYISVLVELTRMEGTKHGPLVATQLLDVAIRVQAIRKYAVQQCALLLKKSYLLLTGKPRSTMSEVLYAAAWICGEFTSELEDPLATLQSMLRPQASSLPGHIQAVYVHNILKLATATLCKAESDGDIETMKQIYELKYSIAALARSGDLEVQERSSSALVLLECLKENPGLAQELMETFEGELNPVAPKAQRKVPIPEDLDLDSWINDPPSESSDSEDLDMNDIFVKTEKASDSYSKRHLSEPSPEELEKRREARKQEQENNPHYLKGTFKNSTSYHNSSNIYEEFENIPVAELDIPVSLKITNNHKRYKGHGKKKKKSKKNKKSASEDELDDDYPMQMVNTGIGELPPGAELSDSDNYDHVDENDPHRALNIDLDMPLRDDERLPVLEHRVAENNLLQENIESKGKKKEKGHKKSKKKVKEHREKQYDNPLELTDMWLENDISAEKVQSPINAEYTEVFGEKDSQRRDAKRKKSKNQEKHKKTTTTDGMLQERKERKKTKSKKEKKISDYEETAGISTPSKEILPDLRYNFTNSVDNANLIQPLPMYEKVAKNEVLSIMYKLKEVSHESESEKLVVSIFVTNNSQKLVKKLFFDVTDSYTFTVMTRHLGDELPPHASAETEISLLFTYVQFGQSLKGTLTYVLENEESTLQEKFDFSMPLTCRMLMSSNLSRKDVLTDLLTSGRIVYKARKEIFLSQDFDVILYTICSKCNLTLVERIDDTASLYGISLKGDHMCFLLKYNKSSNNLVIEGKGNSSLLSAVVCEILEIMKCC